MKSFNVALEMKINRLVESTLSPYAQRDGGKLQVATRATSCCPETVGVRFSTYKF